MDRSSSYNPGGVIIDKVTPDSPAAACGIHAGDRLLKVDEVDMEKISHVDAIEVLKRTRQTVFIVVSRVVG